MASIKERSGSYQITVSLGRDIYGKKLPLPRRDFFILLLVHQRCTTTHTRAIQRCLSCPGRHSAP